MFAAATLVGAWSALQAITPSIAAASTACMSSPAWLARLVRREDVAQLGDVLAGTAAGRRNEDDITIFDSTGLAIQDLAIALDALAKTDELDLPMLDL